MRKFKFRAWDKVAKQWLWVTGIETAETSKSDGYTLEGIFHDGDFVGHEDIIVTQYTGLKDENGKEIYEGDIFRDNDTFLWQVYFEDGMFLAKGGEFNLTETLIEFTPNHCEVISNIFENPELLEESQIKKN